MKILGIEFNIKRADKTEQKGLPVVSTAYANNPGNTVDGTQIAWSNRTFGEMYRKSVDIRTCIRKRQITAMRAGWEIRKTAKTTANEKVVTIQAFNDAMKNITEIKNQILKNDILFGNVFIQRVVNKIGQVLRYKVLDSRFVTIITDSELNPVRYIYTDVAIKGSYIELPAEQVMHFKRDIDFDNPIFGDSVMEALVIDVLGEKEAALSNYYFFQNDSIPSAIYILKEGVTGTSADAVMEQIKTTLTGGHNKHKAIVSNAVEDIKMMRQEHKDMDFLYMRKFTTEKVCAALGVSRVVLGYVEDVNHSNGDSQYKTFIQETVEPDERWLEEIFTYIVQNDFKEPDCVFNIDSEHIDNIEQLSGLAQKNIAAGVWTVNEARLFLGYEAVDNEMADQIIIGSSLQLLDNIASVDASQTNPATLPTAV